MNDPCKLIPVNYLKYRVSAFFNLNIDLTWSELTNASSDFMLSFNGSSVQSIIRIHSHSTLSSTMHKVMEREGRLWNGCTSTWFLIHYCHCIQFLHWQRNIKRKRWNQIIIGLPIVRMLIFTFGIALRSIFICWCM